MLGGSSHVHRFSSLVHPSDFSGLTLQTSHWNHWGYNLLTIRGMIHQVVVHPRTNHQPYKNPTKITGDLLPTYCTKWDDPPIASLNQHPPMVSPSPRPDMKRWPATAAWRPWNFAWSARPTAPGISGGVNGPWWMRVVDDWVLSLLVVPHQFPLHIPVNIQSISIWTDSSTIYTYIHTSWSIFISKTLTYHRLHLEIHGYMWYVHLYV